MRYKADLPVQIVLQPHLQSFLPVQDKYLEEFDRFLQRGWACCFTSIPVVPYFFAACESVCRPLEPDRPRCTNDAGAPRHDVFDDDGVRVLPLNEAISESEWPKEVTPLIAVRVLQQKHDSGQGVATEALQQLALAVGAPFRQYQETRPVFVDNDKQALASTTMASALYLVMIWLTGSSEAAKLYTWHSFISHLATALHAAGVKPTIIQAMLRWQIEESLRAYVHVAEQG